MGERERFALHLGIPRILVEGAVFDGVLDELIAATQKTFRRTAEDELTDADKLETITREALSIAC